VIVTNEPNLIVVTASLTSLQAFLASTILYNWLQIDPHALQALGNGSWYQQLDMFNQGYIPFYAMSSSSPVNSTTLNLPFVSFDVTGRRFTRGDLASALPPNEPWCMIMIEQNVDDLSTWRAGVGITQAIPLPLARDDPVVPPTSTEEERARRAGGLMPVCLVPVPRSTPTASPLPTGALWLENDRLMHFIRAEHNAQQHFVALISLSLAIVGAMIAVILYGYYLM
jgi:hypothetical protein